jgi:outer membrane protein OmpA-like peptidoglycan-associated protein
MFVATDLFSEPTNLGPPINSKYDDFSFVINRKFRKGYFTSNRPQGQGADDIYSFVQEDAIKSCSQTIDGIVKTPDGAPVKEATVNIFDDKGEWLNRFVTNSQGRFKIELHKCGQNYKLEATKKHWSKDYTDVIYEEGKKVHKISLFIDKLSKEEIDPNEPKELDIPEGDLFADIKNIEFELNKYYISEESASELDKVVKIMKEYPTIIVEFSAHTDSRGPDDFNLELTEQRAAEVVRYITRKGIDHNRIYGKGYGELFPVNHCVNGVKCTEQQHLENRRTEFVILAK